MTNTCATCRHGHFQPEVVTVGECRRFPRQVVAIVLPDGYGSHTHQTDSLYPTTWADNFCGEWRYKNPLVGTEVTVRPGQTIQDALAEAQSKEEKK